jgi:hypothetical protein
MNDSKDQKKKKSIYKEYWEGLSPENAFNSVDQNGERVCMACKFGCGQKQKTNQRLDGQTKECQSSPIGYVFDR